MIATLFALALAGQEASDPPLDLDLVCDGEADVETSATTNVAPPGEPINFVTTTGRKRVLERVSLSFSEGSGRVRLPSSLLPSLFRGRSDDGWRPMTALSVTSNLITGRMSLNMLDRPTVRIDRITGEVEIRTLSASFRGTCAPVDRSTRRF